MNQKWTAHDGYHQRTHGEMIARCADLLTSLVARLRAAPDGEQVMTLNRGVFCIIMATYIWVIEGHRSHFAPALLIVGLPITVAILGHLLLHPAPHAGRRALAVLIDLGTICFTMHQGDESTAVFFPLILWVICGNGFRFGLPGLWLSTTLGIIGFGAMAATTPFWHESLSLTTGLTLGLFILPTYVSILIKKLYKSKARAEAANEAKSEFLTNVSHELRTPLQAIIGAGGLLARTGLSKEQADLSKTVGEASDVLLTMVGGLLNFSSIERGNVQVNTTTFSIVDLLVEVRKIAFATSQAKGLDVSTHIGLKTPLFVRADRTKILEVLLNLVGNAIKFTESGGLLIAVDRVNIAGEITLLEFEVIDTGPGISLEVQEKVFDKFFSSTTVNHKNHGGLGLGLAICKNLVKVMKGDIGLNNDNPPGATIWFRIPVEPVASMNCQPNPPKAPTILFMPNGVPKGRLYKVLSEQGRKIVSEGSRDRPLFKFLQSTKDGHRVLFVRTPRSDPVYAGFTKLLRTSDANLRPPIILIDEVGQTTPSRDLRWLAPLRLAGNFTDEDMTRALAAADLLAFNAPEQTSVMQAVALKRHNVLIVDDNRTNRTIFAKMVESFGHDYSLAINGEEALVALEQGKFSLVLMDVNMPGIDGLQTTKLQRLAELGLSHTPIIGLTADASPGLLTECRKAGMDDCVVKPVNTQLLQTILAKFDPFDAPTSKITGIVVPFTGKPLEPDVDYALIANLEKIGGREFVNDVLADFGRDVGSLVDELKSALARTDIAAMQFTGHALASAAANIGAVRVRSIGLRIEKMPEVKLGVDGQEIIKTVILAIERFMEAIKQ